MNVVGFGIDLDGRATKAVERAAHVGMKVGANVIWQHAFPMLRGKNQVDVNLGQGLWHASKLSRPFRAHNLSNLDPGHRSAQPWAWFWRLFEPLDLVSHQTAVTSPHPEISHPPTSRPTT